MKSNYCPAILALGLLVASLCASHAQPATNLHLRLEPRTNAFDLVVDGDAASGAFLIYQAHDLQSLLTSPSVAVQTNTALENGLRFTLPAPGASPSQAFFTAAHWPGRTVEEFGEPEDYPDIPPPTMVLFTSGAPANLASGQTFIVDFFVTDPRRAVARRVGTGGHSGLQRVRWRTPSGRDGFAAHGPVDQRASAARRHHSIHCVARRYVLGLGPSSGGLAGFLEELFFHAASGLDQFLKTAFNLGPAPLTTPTRESLLQMLEQRRTDNADAGPSWSYPLAGSGHPVSGTFGEWRGRNNNNVHR